MSEENQGQEGQEENETVAELEETGDMEVPANLPPQSVAPPANVSAAEDVDTLWKPEAGHASAARILVSPDATQEEVDVEAEKSRGALNFLLILLIILVAVGAFMTLQKTDGFYSEEGVGLNGIIDLKEALARHEEQEFTYEERKKQKMFGTLQIASDPKGAMICTDKATLSRINLDEESKAKLQKCPNPGANGEELVQLTVAPGKIEGVDTAHLLSLVAQREGFRDFPMFVGTHLWPVNQGADAQHNRVIKMVPEECNRWQTNDSQMGTISFYSYMHCEGYTKSINSKKKAGRTTDGCVCKPQEIDNKNKKKK